MNKIEIVNVLIVLGLVIVLICFVTAFFFNPTILSCVGATFAAFTIISYITLRYNKPKWLARNVIDKLNDQNSNDLDAACDNYMQTKDSEVYKQYKDFESKGLNNPTKKYEAINTCKNSAKTELKIF